MNKCAPTQAGRVTRECPKCHRQVVVVNHGREHDYDSIRAIRESDEREQRQFLAHILAGAEDHGGWRAGMTNDDYLLQADAVIASGFVVYLPLDCQDYGALQAEVTAAQADAWDAGFKVGVEYDYGVDLAPNPHRGEFLAEPATEACGCRWAEVRRVMDNEPVRMLFVGCDEHVRKSS